MKNCTKLRIFAPLFDNVIYTQISYKIMQGKGIVKGLFIVLLLVTAYQLMLMWPTYKVESEAASSCNGMTSGQCYTDYLDSISDETVFSIPLIKDFTYSELKGQQIGFGLDLKGGMSAVVQVDLRAHLRSMADKDEGEDPMFETALNNAQKALASSQGDYLTVFGNEWDKIAGPRPLGDVFSYNQNYSDVITLNSTTDEVINALREDTKSVVKQTFNMLTQRIDKFGVVQPSINLDESRDLIL
ncbi:MAG: protein translocase subunit SecDF, partial [Saprospiraceae bacterium]